MAHQYTYTTDIELGPVGTSTAIELDVELAFDFDAVTAEILDIEVVRIEGSRPSAEERATLCFDIAERVWSSPKMLDTLAHHAFTHEA